MKPNLNDTVMQLFGEHTHTSTVAVWMAFGETPWNAAQLFDRRQLSTVKLCAKRTANGTENARVIPDIFWIVRTAS